MIVRQGNNWQVQSESGKNLGTYKSEGEAARRLEQVEYWKARKPAKPATRLGKM
jgi:hypothetical protein